MQICPVKFWQRCKNNSMEERLPFQQVEPQQLHIHRQNNEWTASLIQWTWIWGNSGRWWWTKRPGVLQFTGSQRVGHDLATEQQQTNFDRNLTPYTTCSSKLIQNLNVKLFNFYVFKKLFIHLYLTVTGLHCHTQAFSSCAWASHCSDFSYCTAHALGLTRFNSCNT